MAIKPTIKTVRTVSKEVKKKLQERSGITHWSKDGIAKSMTDAIANEQSLINDRASRALESLQISSASGRALEALGENRGVRRLAPGYAQSAKNERNVFFYCSSTFGDINGGADIVIPAGTVITPGDSLTPGRVSQSSQSIVYVTIAKYTLPAGSSSYYCGVKAKTPGTLQNVAENVLVSHGFTAYTDFANGAPLKCKNNYSIINGQELEDDKSLRFRISNHYASIAGATQDALLLRSLTVPGVLDLRIEPNFYGIGTCAAFVFGQDSESTTSLVRKVQEKINAIQTAGIRILASPGVKVHFDFDLIFYTETELNSNDKASVRRAVKRTLDKYFSTRSRAPARVISLEAIRKSMANNVDITNKVMDRGSSRELFNNVYLRKNYSGTRVASERVTLDTFSYTLEKYEFATLGTLQVRFQKTDVIV
jgi:uncharacterized phage protein gp47/JayE